ncbi:unnamed protein product [Brassicogethes aeneus]|uniref:Pleckstrin homology-like domain family B member 1 n=1 Tax=Brassicogethes aeneus TaxID=1431903 RepID=A0A9P0AQN8_BRAAE|nr:unnamed protein product [Brassicogethes aeneus]
MSGVSLAGGQHPATANNGVGGGAVELSDSGGRALKLQTDAPHLVSMGGDRLSTSVTLHPIPQGRITLGSGQGVDISVQGTGVLPLHCHIENSEGVVTIYPLSENLSIDGVKVNGPTRLSQGVMLTIGRSNYMRFNHPAEAKLMKSVLPNPRISMAPIYFEPDNSFQPKFNKKPPVAPRKSPRESLSDSGSDDTPSSFMTKVSKFEYLAAQNFKKSISPKVFSSNLVTVNTPAKDVLGKAPPDFNSFSKNLPQSALNYVELNYNEKQNEKEHVQTNDRPMFSRKQQAQYVNVTVNETKTINNRVFIYENGGNSKTNVNFDHNELNNKSSSSNKNINVNRVASPSPSYNRNPTAQYYRSVTPSPVSNSVNVDHRRSGSLGELTNGGYNIGSNEEDRKHEAELRRNQAQQDRIKEQEIGKAEQQRLEEILNMCAEYEKQNQTDKQKPKPPKKPVRRTNGSLPRNKSQPSSPSYTTPPPSPLDVLHNELLKQNNHNYENHIIYSPTSNVNYENVEIRSNSLDYRSPHNASPYENVYLQNPPAHYQGSKSKYILANNRDLPPKESTELIDNKFAILEAEQLLLQEAEKLIKQNRHNSKEIPKENQDFLEGQRKSTPTKFILPLEDEGYNKNCPSPYDNKLENSSHSFNSSSEYNRGYQSEEEKARMDKLRKEKKDIMAVISRIKRQMAEIEIQEEELHREIQLEKALLSGELKSKQLEIEKNEAKKEKLQTRAQKIEDNMKVSQVKQEEDQEKCKEKLNEAQDHMNEMEEKLAKTEKNTAEYEQVFQEYMQAQEDLDNEKKTFEDLEFHHLEEEADWLASREELQREISDLTAKNEGLEQNIDELETEKNNLTKSNTAEYKTIEKQKLECLLRLEEIRNRLKTIDSELLACSNQESEQEISSDSESDKSKDIEKHFSNLSLNQITDMSCSVIVSSQKIPEHVSNMSQSFNEKLLQEKSILEEGIAKRFPSQDDIDRFSKVTSDSPININESQGSLGKKTIESLREIERNRHIHLCQQGSQVIEQERQRVQALKQKVQEEVRIEWAQRNQEDFNSIISYESETRQSSVVSGMDIDQKNEQNSANSISEDQINLNRSEMDADSPRPLSETSEMSLEVGTLNRKRSKPISDKQRPLTRYLPIRGSDLDLRQHIESAGHQVVLCPHVLINSSSCRGFLHKKGSKLNGWSRRWFVFDRNKHTFSYYSDKSEKKARGGAYFQAIEEVYLDHLNNIKSPNPQLTFIVKTHERLYYLMAPSPEAMRIWVDVIFTGAEGYREFQHGT